MGLSSWFRAQRPYRSIRGSSTACILCISSCFLHSYFPTNPPVALFPPLPALSFSPVISLPGRLGASRAVQTTLFMSVILMLIQCSSPGAQRARWALSRPPHWAPLERKQVGRASSHLQMEKLRQEPPGLCFSARHPELSPRPTSPLSSPGPASALLASSPPHSLNPPSQRYLNASHWASGCCSALPPGKL